VYEHPTFGRRCFLKRVSLAGAVGVVGVLQRPLPGAEQEQPARRRKRPGGPAVEDFSELVGSRFQVEYEPGRFVAVELIEVNRLKDHGKPEFREPFSLVFRVPGKIRLPQDVYRVWHRRMGRLPLLMVPVDLPARFNRLETIFA